MTKIVSFFAALALLISWLVPNHYFPWATAYNEFAAFFAALLLSIIIIGKPIKLNRSALFFVLLAAIPLIQYACGIIFFWGDAFITSAYLLGFTLMLLVGYNLIGALPKQQKAYEMLAYLFLVGSIISIGLALSQWLMLFHSFWVADLQPGGRPFANLGQPNMLASLLCIGIASCLYLFETRRIQAFTASLVALFFFFGIALTQSRTPWIGALFAIGWWWWKNRDAAPRFNSKMMLGWLTLYIVFIFAIPLLSNAIGITPLETRDQSSSHERFVIWQQMLTAILNGPIWGYGWNQVSTAQYTISYLIPAVTMTEHSHNLILDFLVWNGPLLGIILLLVIAAWLLKLTWGLRSKESVFGMMIIGFLMIHAMLEFPLDYAFFLLPAGLILGMIEADQLPSRTLTLPRPLYIILIAAAGYVYSMVWQEYRLIDEDTRLLRFEMAHVGTLRAKQPAPDVIMLTQLREYTRMSRTTPTAHMTAAQVKALHDVAYRSPTKFALSRYNTALALNDQPGAELERARLKGLYGTKVYQTMVAQIAAERAKQH